MDLICETKIFNLSTRSSACTVLNGDYKSQIEYYNPAMITRDESIEYILFSIPYALIPLSYYIVNETNNVLDVYQNNIKTSYLFPVGNYSASLFMTQFTTTMGSGWSITLNSTTSKFTIKHNSLAFQLLESSSIDFVLGFTNTISSSLVSGFHTAVMSRVCNFLPLPRINIRSDELSSGSLDNTVLCIPNNSKLNGQIVYQNATNQKLLFRESSLNRFVIFLTDDDGNLINFNGISSFFSFQFDIFRKFTPKLPSFNKIVEMQVNREKFYFEDPENDLIDGDT
jgi:hypothetical protein